MPTSMPQQTLLTHDSFYDFMHSHRFAVIHFWATWNGYDHIMRRLLESQITEDFREQVAFASLDIEPPAHQELCNQHNVLNVPFLAFYRDGSLRRTVTGMRTPDVITEYLRDLVYGA